MAHVSAHTYAAEMRLLEHIRNEALTHRDASALREIRLRVASLNKMFWGRHLRAV